MAKFTSKQIARFKAIQASKARKAANENAPARTRAKSAYVDTTMTPGMLADCVAAAGLSMGSDIDSAA